MSKKIKFVFVGKLKKKFWKEAEDFYEKKLLRWFNIKKHIIKDADGHLPVKERIKVESDRILKIINSNDIVICLDEKGKSFCSIGFAKKLTEWMESPARTPCFIIGGAYGIDEVLRKRADILVSLGTMTFTHEMARIILLEQIYRAHQILNNSPYHH